MKNYVLLFFVLLLIGFQTATAQNFFDKPENRNRHHLILLHPTASNLQWYQNLVAKGYFSPGDLTPVGLYFEEEKTNYSQVIQDFPEIGFQMISGKLNNEDVFKENDFTGEFHRIFEYSEGVIFNGGPDIQPALYAEPTTTLSAVTEPHRHSFEISFMFHLIGSSRNPEFTPFLKENPRYMVLGICLGMQTMAVAAGGTLIQDIPSEIYGFTTVEEITASDPDLQHLNYLSKTGADERIQAGKLHKIEPVDGRWFSRKLKKEWKQPLSVYSSHHQAVDIANTDLRTAAFSMDEKIIEAVEHSKFPNVIGVQFHPEIAALYDPAIKIQTTATGLPESFNERLKEDGSLEFHIAFWQEISRLLK